MRLLYLNQILQENTDEKHSLKLEQLIEHLRKAGFVTSKKTIKSDLDKLETFGVSIREHEDSGYYLANRSFETAELKLLVDAVQSSKFITLNKSQKMIKKLSHLASIHEAKNLERQVFVVNRIKAGNEDIFANVDRVYDAISQDRRIAFHYFEYDVDKSVKYRNKGEKYTVSPLALCWDDENYYMIANYHKHDGLTHFRVDKMQNIDVLEEKRVSIDEDGYQFNAADYQKRVFSMFGGIETSVTIEFAKQLINVAIDRFGKDVIIHNVSETHFQFTTKVAISPAFYSWVFQFGDKAKIISPASVKQDMKKMVAASAAQY